MATLRRITEDLRQARVLVIHPKDEDGATLVDHLKRLGCDVKAAWPAPAKIGPDIDAVFIHVGDAPIDGFVSLIEDTNAAIIGIVTYESPTSLKAIIDINAHGVLTKPLRQAGILTQFALARYRAGYEQRLANKVQKLEDTLKGRRSIEKAVKILATSNAVDEDAAYRMIRDQATARRLSIVTIAEGIISADEAMRAFGLRISKAEPKPGDDRS